MSTSRRVGGNISRASLLAVAATHERTLWPGTSTAETLAAPACVSTVSAGARPEPDTACAPSPPKLPGSTPRASFRPRHAAPRPTPRHLCFSDACDSSTGCRRTNSALWGPRRALPALRTRSAVLIQPENAQLFHAASSPSRLPTVRRATHHVRGQSVRALHITTTADPPRCSYPSRAVLPGPPVQSRLQRQLGRSLRWRCRSAAAARSKLTTPTACAGAEGTVLE